MAEETKEEKKTAQESEKQIKVEIEKPKRESVKDKKWIRLVESKFLRTDLPELKPGHKVKVWYKVKEGEKERTTFFEGTVIAIRGGGPNKTFTVRKVSQGVGIERIFPYYSPYIVKIEILGKMEVRRAKLYYLREK